MSSFKELYKDHNRKLSETDYFKRAFNSALYHEKWKENKIAVDNIKGFTGLQTLPFSSADDLRKTWEKYPIDEILLSKIVGLWYCTSGSMGNRKWIPWTYTDYNRTRNSIGEIVLKFLKPDDKVMSIMLPSPFISGSTAFRILEGTASKGFPIEQIALTPEYVADSFGLLRKRQPTAIFCTPSLTLRMAEEIAINTPIILKSMAEEQKKAILKVASVATKLVKIKPKTIFKEMKIGFFGGESLEPFRKAIEEQWGIEAFDIYAFTEGYGAGYECHEHNGLHFPSINGIIEIIPQSEIEKEEINPDYKPEAILFSEAEEGLIGEIVLTDFKEALPIIRYRIRDLVKVISTDGCSCGDDSPRLKIMGRTDSVINLGFIRLSALIFDQLLMKDFKTGKVRFWEVFVSREKYRPKISLTIEPEQIKNEDEFKKELFNSLHNFDLFQRGYDNGLFLFDEIKFVEKLEREIYGQGKTRRIKYHPDFFKAVKY
ncbi:MAG TPA: GH3 auxin-responsive promoter family protein [candidate division Zixibacteria bacterium]|nr:GH3 auxin-responsive promoter family protein [candidate division Zixibacteria bacterium]